LDGYVPYLLMGTPALPRYVEFDTAFVPAYIHILCSYKRVFLHVYTYSVHTSASEVTFGFKAESQPTVQRIFPNTKPIDARVLTRDPADESDNRGRNGRDDDDVVVAVMAQQGAGSLVVAALEDCPP
jgi:hypothetical protein